MKIFIFGASGYLGSNLVNYLKNNHEVFACVRTKSSLKRLTCDNSKIITGIDNAEVLDDAFMTIKPDLIINAAALYGRNGEGIDKLVDANISFPSQLYELCKKYGVGGFLNTGTSLPDNVSQYALTKNTFVRLACSKNERKLKFINIALEHFYGPNDDDNKFISYVIKSCLEGKTLELTNGKQKRDFIHIKDVISAFDVIISQLDNIEHGETIALGSGVALSVREIVEIIAVASRTESILNFGTVADRKNELMYSCADVFRLASLGWTSSLSIEEGLLDTITIEKSTQK